MEFTIDHRIDAERRLRPRFTFWHGCSSSYRVTQPREDPACRCSKRFHWSEIMATDARLSHQVWFDISLFYRLL